MTLSKKNLRDIARAERTVGPGDLYRALHRVGDDFVKTDIEEALREVLDEATYCKVVAVFKVGVSP